VVSESEVRDLPEQQLFDLGEIVCVTRGERGVRIWRDGSWFEIPAIPAAPVDLTGAGDVWATTFAIALSEQNDLEGAGRYASVAAAISIESAGLTGCPSREAITERSTL
jgi:sugar/nucleoside kinase (ribokinase family)